MCKEHYRAHLKKNPISTFLDTRADLLKWTIMIHNEVNKMLEKPEWTEYEIMEYYERLGRRDRSPVWTKDDMKEIDFRSFIRGFITGTLVLSGVGVTVYLINKYQQ